MLLVVIIGYWCSSSSLTVGVTAREHERGFGAGDADILFLALCAGYTVVFNLWKIFKLYLYDTYIFFSEYMLYFNKNFKKWNQESTTMKWFYWNYLMISSFCIYCVQGHRGSLLWGTRKKKKEKQGYLNKWHLQIFSSKNNLRLPGWLAEWQHVYLKLATWFINIWSSRSIKKRRM